MDQSAPRGSSTNDSIDVEKFPADMAGMHGLLRMFNYAGRGSRMSKCDWRDAYKHVGISRSQWQYQYFAFAGAYFCEVRQNGVVYGGYLNMYYLAEMCHIRMQELAWDFLQVREVASKDSQAGAGPAGGGGINASGRPSDGGKACGGNDEGIQGLSLIHI